MGQVLCLPEEQRQKMAAWAANAYPHEACGLLLGRREADGARIVEALPARNIATARLRDRFEVDPADYLAAECRARDAGMELVGIWHSHPDHPARPSPTDREMAWSGWSYVIVSVAAGRVGELRSWRLDGRQEFKEEEVR